MIGIFILLFLVLLSVIAGWRSVSIGLFFTSMVFAIAMLSYHMTDVLEINL